MRVLFFVCLFIIVVGLVVDRFGWRRMETRRRRRRRRLLERSQAAGVDPLAEPPGSSHGRVAPAAHRRQTNRQRMIAHGDSPFSIFVVLSITAIMVVGAFGLITSFGCEAR